MTPRLRRYVRLAAAAYGTTPRQIIGYTRDGPSVRARWSVMRRLRGDGFSYTQIGGWMKRDHSTIHHGCKQWERIRD